MHITGTTRLYVIFGDPLHKARSPETFNAIFAARGMDAVLVPGEVDAEGFADAVRGFKRLRNCAGIIITMPHKQTMCRFVDELGENARVVGAINAARRLPDGRWHGDMFDGLGYVAALRKKGMDPRGKSVHMIGAGAVACAMSVALAQAGMADITLRDPAPGRAEALVQMLHKAFPTLRARAIDGDEFERDIIANAAPLGMREGDPLPCDPGRISPQTLVSDVIPKPEITPFLAAAMQRGCTVVSGRDMVEGQAGLIAEFLGVGKAP